MELQYGLKQPFKFYEKLEHQNRIRVGGSPLTYAPLAPNGYILPFQIRRGANPLPIQSVKAVEVFSKWPAEDGPGFEIIDRISEDDFKLLFFGDYDYLVNFGNIELSEELPVGYFYLAISDGATTWYSEVIQISDFDPFDLAANGCAYTKFEYWRECDLDGFLYRTTQFKEVQYKNRVFFDIELGRSSYEISAEGAENGNGDFKADSIRLEKEYLLQGVFPEFMADALAFISLHTTEAGVVEVYTKEGFAKVLSISTNPEWQGDKGIWALTDVNFTTYSVTAYGCCDAEIKDNDQIFLGCVRNGLHVLATIRDSEDVINYRYTRATDNVKVDLVNGDIVIIGAGATGNALRVFTYADSEYTPFDEVFPPGRIVIDDNEAATLGLSFNPVNYFWTEEQVDGVAGALISEPTSTLTRIAGDRYSLSGESWNDCAVEIWERVGSSFSLNTVGSGYDYNAGGIEFDQTPTASYVFTIFKGLTCELGRGPNQFYPTPGGGGDPDGPGRGGIGVMAIESSFHVGSSGSPGVSPGSGIA